MLGYSETHTHSDRHTQTTDDQADIHTVTDRLTDTVTDRLTQ